MNAWKWKDQPRRVPVAVLSGRSHINHRHLALIREHLEAEPVPEGAAVLGSVPRKTIRLGAVVGAFGRTAVSDH
jgi:hypothetical protein